jgi:D-3-phosphoglycerate dehydrogenase / 2-oxoglutarate reductase
VANYGKAFGMRIIAYGREGSQSRAHEDGIETVSSQRELFAQSDVLSVHLKLVKDTQGIITGDDLVAMKSTALFVNTSRAELVVSGALEKALQAGRPGFAAVDVYEDEPVVDHPLLHMPNALCTPHIGYVERDSYELYFGVAFDQLLSYFAGNPINILNPDALK